MRSGAAGTRSYRTSAAPLAVRLGRALRGPGGPVGAPSGIVVRLHRSVFAAPAARRFSPPETRSPAAFRVVYLRHLRALWQRDPRAFLDLLDLAGGGADVTLVDDFEAASRGAPDAPGGGAEAAPRGPAAGPAGAPA